MYCYRIFCIFHLGVVRGLQIAGHSMKLMLYFALRDVRNGSKPCCIFNESLTSLVPLSHYLSY